MQQKGGDIMLLERFDTLKDFSETEKAIAWYLVQNLHILDDLTVSKLAQDTYTSNATVIRFCKRLGFSGFRDMKIQLVREASARFRTLPRIDADMPFAPGDDIMVIGSKLEALICGSVERTYRTLSPEAVYRAVDYIRGSKRLFVFGKGDSYIRAATFRNQMIKINRYVILADENHEASYNAQNITAEDCVLFITYSAHQYDFDAFIKLFRKQGIPTIILTANARSYLASQCDVILCIPQDESSTSKVAGFASCVCMEYVLDMLYAALFNQDYRDNYNQKQKKETYVNRIIGK